MAPRPLGRSLHLALVAALAWLLLGGCSGAEDDPGRGTTDDRGGANGSRDNTVVEPTWVLDEEVLGQPVVTGRTAVVLVRARTDEVDVVAVDADTGVERWRAPYQPVINSFWAAEPFVANPDTDDAAVVFPAPTPGGDAFLRRVRSVGPVSGRDLYSPPELSVVGALRECPDGEDACATGTDDDGYGNGPQRILRVGPSSSSVGPDYSGAPDGAYTVGPAGTFLLPGGPGGGRVGRAVDGRVLFTRTAAEVAGRGRDTNRGGDFDRDRRSRTLVGWIAPERPAGAVEQYRREGYALDLEKWDQLVGLDERSGERLWRAEGADACPGVDDTAVPRARCVAAGTVTFTEDEDTDWALESARAEGYEPRTGVATWSLELDPVALERVWDRSRAIASPDGRRVVLPLPDGPAYVDLGDGTTSPVADDDRFGCFGREVQFGYGDDEDDDARRAGRLVSACDGRGRAAGDLLVADAVRDAGEAVGDERRDTWVLSTSEGLVGYDLAAG